MYRLSKELPKPVKLIATVGDHEDISVFIWRKDLSGLPSIVRQTVTQEGFHHLEIGTAESVLRFEVVE